MLHLMINLMLTLVAGQKLMVEMTAEIEDMVTKHVIGINWLKETVLSK